MTVQHILQYHQDQHYITIANTCEKCYTNQRNNKTGYDRGGTATCIFSGHEWKELTLYFWKVCSDFASTLVGGVLDEGLTFRPVLIWSSAHRILSHHLISITVPEAGLQECVHVCVVYFSTLANDGICCHDLASAHMGNCLSDSPHLSLQVRPALKCVTSFACWRHLCIWLLIPP